MTMPRNLVLIRHGESEGNIASKRSQAGDHSAFTEAFRARHSSQWRLSEKGRGQAAAAKKWMEERLQLPFNRHYSSEYIRAMETAAHLCIENVEWYVDFYLRERDWGDLDVMPIDERERLYANVLRKREIDAFYWTPPNGQSMADLCLRVDRVIDTLHRECSDQNVVIVCHGEVMWAFRMRLERMSQSRFRELDLSDDSVNRIHNCQILHYTRASNPEGYATGSCLPYLSWMRSVCPWDLKRSSNGWQKIVRSRYSNADLLRHVNMVKPLIT